MVKHLEHIRHLVCEGHRAGAIGLVQDAVGLDYIAWHQRQASWATGGDGDGWAAKGWGYGDGDGLNNGDGAGDGDGDPAGEGKGDGDGRGDGGGRCIGNGHYLPEMMDGDGDVYSFIAWET